MKTRFKIVTSALALIIAIGGGSITFGGSNRGRESNKDASESTRPVNLEDTGFAGPWTGQGFTATIANDGTGTVTRTPCTATLSFTSLVDHVLTLRYVVTADSDARCIRTGVITARMNAKNSSTWNFVGEDGSTVSGSATRVITPRVNRELLASFAGTATGGVAPADFTVVLNRSGSGTITFPTLHCSGTLTFISFDNVVLKLRLEITVRQGSLCVENGVASATKTTPGSSTWRFVGDSGIITDGVTVSSAVTVTPDHSCDHASEKAAKLSEHQAELSQRIGKLQAQTNALNAGRAKAVLDGNLKKVASIDKRIAGIQHNIEHKQSQMNDNNDEEHNVEHHCNITPPPPTTTPVTTPPTTTPVTTPPTTTPTTTNTVTATVTVGVEPIAVGFDGTSIWVANLGSGTVSKINPTTNTVTATVTVGVSPVGVAFDGTSIWVANRESGTVSKINTTTNTLTATVTVGVDPVGVAFDGTSIWVTNAGSGTVSKINPTTNSVTATVAVGGSPFGVAFDGTSIWVTSSTGSGSVSKINTTTNTVTATVTVGASPQGVAFDGTSIWVANTNSGTVSKINPTTNTVTATIPFGLFPWGVGFDGTSIWVTEEFSGTVRRINTTTNTVTSTVTVGTSPFGVGFDGTSIWVTNYGSGTVSKITV